MKVSQKGINLIKKYEGCKLESYVCPAGVLTIGYGSTGSHVKRNMKITEQEAEKLLQKDLERFEIGVLKSVKVNLTQNQFDSLVSFSYNCGLGNLQSSTLLKLLNLGDKQSAAKEFVKWCKANGKVLDGLLKRRLEEQKLFLS